MVSFYRKKSFPPRIPSFTVLELVMVVVIIGILMVLSLPRFEIFYDIKLQGATKKLASDIRYIQSIAMAQRTNTKIVFDDSADTYRASSCNSNCSIPSNWSPLKDPFTRMDLVMSFTSDPQYGGIDIYSVDFGGTNTLRFDWQGIPQDANGNELTTQGAVILRYKDKEMTIRVFPQTGKVRIE